MSRVDRQEMSLTELSREEHRETGVVKTSSTTLPKELLSSTRIVQVLPDRTRTRKGVPLSRSESKKNLQKAEQDEEPTVPREEPPKNIPITDPATPIAVEKGNTALGTETTPTAMSEGRPKRNTPRLHRFIDDFVFMLAKPVMRPVTKPEANKKEPTPPLYDENGNPIKRKRGRPSNREKLEAQLQAAQRAEMQAKRTSKGVKQPQPVNKPISLDHPETPKQSDPSGTKEKRKSKSKKSTQPEKENQIGQPVRKKVSKPKKHPLPETPSAPDRKSKSLPVPHKTPSSKRKNGSNSAKRKSLPQGSAPKSRKSITLADLITESESTGNSDHEDSAITSGDEQADATFRASSVRIGPNPTAYHPILNPLPGFIDAITCTEIIRPAISPYGHVLSWETWIKVLCFGDPKTCVPSPSSP